MNAHRQPQFQHRCLMVYPSGAREALPRMTGQLHIWILSNKSFHPSAALFVDGRCRYEGHLSADEIKKLEGELV
jgi:hypothetical protein